MFIKNKKEHKYAYSIIIIIQMFCSYPNNNFFKKTINIRDVFINTGYTNGVVQL